MSTFLAMALAGLLARQEAVELKSVRFSELSRAVRALQGKVVIVDVWHRTWTPCIKAMPHLVEMAEKWRDKGVVVLTLHVETSLDVEEGRDKSIEKARKILERLKVRGPNYHLAETQTVWMDRLEIEGYPAIFVFNKAGRIARKFADEEEAKTEMATLIPKLTEEK